MDTTRCDDFSQPLTVDCSIEYDLDMRKFPGWDDPWARAQPTLMLHLPASCTCNCYLGTDTSPCLSPTEDELASVLDDELDLLCYENDDCLQHMIDAICSTHAPEVVPELTDNQTVDEDFIPDAQTLVDFLCDPYISGPLLTSPESSVWPSESETSTTQSCDLDIDFLLISPNVPEEPQQPTPCRKRKHSGDSDSQPATKRPCFYGISDLFDELDATFNRSTGVKASEPDSEMFCVGVRE